MSKPNSGIEVVDRPEFTCSFEMPKKSIAEYGTANMKFKPLLVESEVVVVRYQLPFGLNAEPRGRVAVITKDGPGGERVGDILRFTTQWKQGQPSIFDVSKCLERRLDESWGQVVSALVSNDGTYADSIVLARLRAAHAHHRLVGTILKDGDGLYGSHMRHCCYLPCLLEINQLAVMP